MDVPAVGAEAQAQAKAKAKAKKAAAEAGAAAAGGGKPRGGKKADGDGSKECVDYTGSTYRGENEMYIYVDWVHRYSRSPCLLIHTHPPRPLPTGVFWSYGKWRATIRSHHRNQHLGTFESEEQAARAFDAAAKETYDKPILNFLPDGSLNPNRKQRVAAQRLQTKK